MQHAGCTQRKEGGGLQYGVEESKYPLPETLPAGQMFRFCRERLLPQLLQPILGESQVVEIYVLRIFVEQGMNRG